MAMMTDFLSLLESGRKRKKEKKWKRGKKEREQSFGEISCKEFLS